MKAPRNKAAGPEEHFVEALNGSRYLKSKIICEIWRKCSQMKYLLKYWGTAFLVPIYKKGDRANPQSYRPIALRSHARKVVEATMARLVRKRYKFSECQLALRHGIGTEKRF